MRTPRSPRTASGSCLHQPAKGRPICFVSGWTARDCERLTDSPAFDDQAAFSPDGRAVAFVSSRSGQADIWVLELETRRLVNVTNHPAGDFRPAWAPDGRSIAFSSDRDSPRSVRGAPGGLMFVAQQSTDIYVAHLDGSPDGKSVRRVTHGNAVAGTPSWSRDGSSILFYEADLKQQLHRGLGTTQIVSVAVATGERQVLTSGEGIKLFPQSLGNGAHWLCGAADRRSELRAELFGRRQSAGPHRLHVGRERRVGSV